MLRPARCLLYKLSPSQRKVTISGGTRLRLIQGALLHHENGSREVRYMFHLRLLPLAVTPSGGADARLGRLYTAAWKRAALPAAGL